MKYNLIEKTLDASAITAGKNTSSMNVSGCDLITIVLVASGSSTPVGATIQLAGSLDDVTYIAIGSAVSVTGDGTFVQVVDRPAYKYYRVAFAISSGSYNSVLKVLAKGDVGS